MRSNTIKHLFVESFPDQIDPGILYISLKFSNMTHLCCCGCGQEVVTPLSPKDWKLIYDGESASVHPSIGSWNLPCRSHYFIRSGKICWAKGWSDAQIEAARRRDVLIKVGADDSILTPEISTQDDLAPRAKRVGVIRRLVNYIIRGERS